MLYVTPFLRWGWVLFIALIAPVTLPAGGAEASTKLQIRRRNASGPFVAENTFLLRSSPCIDAPALRNMQVGTPFRVVRGWHSLDRRNWIQVQLLSTDILSNESVVRRGWING